MKNALDKQYLESAAHAYVATSNKLKNTDSDVDLRKKNMCRMALQGEALRYAADVMAEWTRMEDASGRLTQKCQEGIDQLRRMVKGVEAFLADLDKR